MLTEKKGLFNWLIPSKKRTGRTFHGDLKVNFKYGTTYLSRRFLAALAVKVDPTNAKVAFLINENSKHLVVSPPAGVPFYTFSAKEGANNSPCCQNKQLAETIHEKFGIAKGIKSIDFKLTRFQEIDGMTFYEIGIPDLKDRLTEES